MSGFWKSISEGDGDPSINHVWVTNAPSASHDFSNDTDEDYDNLSGIQGYKLVYVLFASVHGYNPSDADYETLITAIAASLGND